MTDLDQARERMVAQQLEGRGIADRRVLAAMRSIPRHLFIAPGLAEHAYDDGPLPIAADQTISQPYMVALMTEVAELRGHERVLEIGTGSGYQTAVLSQLAAEVYSIEYIAELYESAGRKLASLSTTNCFLRCGDGSEGWPEAQPFDAVLVTAAMPGVARALLQQLTEQGRLIAPIGSEDLQTMVRIRRREGVWREEYFGECRFVKMVGRWGFSP